MLKAIVGPDNRMAAQGRVLESSASCLLDTMQIGVQQAFDAARVVRSSLFHGAPVCPLDAPEFGR